MLVRRLFVLAACLCVGGCTYRDPSVDLLEGELRWMEDQVFMLEDELQSAHQQLADFQYCQPHAVSPCPSPDGRLQPSAIRSAPDRGRSVPRSRSVPPRERSTPAPTDAEDPTWQPPSAAPEYSIIPEEPDVQPEYQIIEPTVELPPEMENPTQAEPSRSLPPPSRQPAMDDLNDGASSLNAPIGEIELQSFYWDEPLADEPEDVVDADVTHIVAEGTISDGYDFDQQPCAPGLLVVVQPRNAAGEYVALAGPLSIVVLDGTKSGESARLARWDIDAADARRKLRSSHYGNGIHLHLPWPETTPDSSELYLFVRYTTVTGRKLECDRLLSEPPGPEWKASARMPAPRKSDISRQPEMSTRPIPPDAPIQLQPVPREEAVTTVSHEAESAAASQPTLPTRRASSRPQWRPYR